jgi:hypothetical protein
MADKDARAADNDGGPVATAVVTTSRTCFVISPIGADRSETRKHADTVFKYIIKPATDQCGMTAYRSDHLRKPGRITHEMHSHILNDDICIALLTGRNPNVYYELAVAQSAARPVVLLIRKGEEIPFDIKDFRYVEYDFKDKKRYAQQLAEFIRSIAAEDWKVPCPIPGMENALKAGHAEFFAESAFYGPHPKWMSLLQQTQRRFFIMGYSLRTWLEGQEFAKILLEKASSGCDVRVLLLHPDNVAMPQLVNERRRDQSLASVRADIDHMYQFMASLHQEQPRIAVRRVLNGCPRSQVTITDARAIFTPYMFSMRPSASPLWDAPSGSPLYRSLEREFEALWEANPA